MALRPEEFARVKTDIHFVDAVRIGRVVNALAFSVELMSSMTQKVDNAPKSVRRHTRIQSIAAGHVAEAIQLFGDMRRRYKDKPFFKLADELVYPKAASDGLNAKNRRVSLIKTIRNAAFHFDHHDKTTVEALKKLGENDPDDIQVYSSESPLAMDFYFDLADIVDFNSYLWTLPEEYSEPERVAEIYKAIAALTKETFFAAHDLLFGLLQLVPFTKDQT